MKCFGSIHSSVAIDRPGSLTFQSVCNIYYMLSRIEIGCGWLRMCVLSNAIDMDSHTSKEQEYSRDSL